MTDIIIYGYDVFKDTTRYNRAAAGVKRTKGATFRDLVEVRTVMIFNELIDAGAEPNRLIMADGAFNSPFGTTSNIMIGTIPEQILPSHKLLNADNPEPAYDCKSDCYD